MLKHVKQYPFSLLLSMLTLVGILFLVAAVGLGVRWALLGYVIVLKLKWSTLAVIGFGLAKEQRKWPILTSGVAYWLIVALKYALIFEMKSGTVGVGR